MNISSLFRDSYNIFTNKVMIEHRKSYAKNELNIKRSNIKTNILTAEQRCSVKEYWNKIGVKKINFDWIGFYSSTYGIFDEKFIPDDIYFTKIDMYYNNSKACRYIDDKNIFSLLFKDIKMPETVVRKVQGVYLDENYKILSKQESLNLCINSDRIIIKPSVTTGGGKGIEFWDSNSSVDKLKGILNKSNNFIVQKLIEQHTSISRIYKDSINTIRIMTLVMDNDVHILSSLIRIGANGKKVDNFSVGGMACGLEDDGHLKKYAFYGNGQKIEKHPQGALFSDYKVPNFYKCKELVKSLAPRFIGFSRLVSWDLALDRNGEPILIEANFSFGGLDLHQMNNGPIFGNLTDQVLAEVFQKR